MRCSSALLRCSSALLLLLLAGAPVRADKLVLFAGGGAGEDNVPATQARLVEPFGIDFDKAGNAYIVELKGGRVLRVDPKGILAVLAGTGMSGNGGDDGPARKATFNGMHSLWVAPGGTVFLADTWNNRIRKLDPATGIVSAFAGTGKKGYLGDGPGVAPLAAQFGGVFCLALDVTREMLVVTDLDNRRIRGVDLKSGAGPTMLLAGNGDKGVPKDGADARKSPLVDPRAAATDSKGNLYILERSGHALRVVDRKGKIRTVAGTGKAGNSGDGGDAREATLNSPKHLCIDKDDNVIIADTGNHVIRKYTPADGKIVRIAGTGKKGDSGTGGDPLSVSFNEPHGVCVQRDGTLYIVDSMNNRVFRWEK